MNNNYNKILKEKLSNESFAFDPNAWDKMEQMLDDKPKRRPIFWWWLAGVSAVALLGFGAFTYVNFNNNETIAQNNFSKNITAINQLSSSINNIKIVSDNEKISDSSALSDKSKTLSGENAQIPQSKKVSNSSSNNNSNNTLLINSINSTNSNNLVANSTSTNKNKSSNKIVASNNSLNTLIIKNNVEKTTVLAILKAEELENELFKNLYLDKQYTEDYFEAKKEKDTSKNVAFELGITNFLGATGVGKQTDLEGENYNALQNELSYSVGLTADILLKNKWAISTGLMFGKTNFKIFQPVNNSFLLNSYQSTSQLLQIPLGLKYYAFSKNNFRLYGNVGIINNIQIREKILFDYAYNTRPSASIELSLNGSNSIGDQFDNNSNNDPRNNKLDNEVAEFFSVNKEKKYYAQIYSGIGAEYTLKNKFAFFVEPRFHSDLSKIGLQEKRAFQLGVSSGMKFKF